MRRLLTVSVASVLVLAACSGDDDATPTTTTVPDTVATTEAPSTSAAPTTPPSSTGSTTPPTTAETTTAPTPPSTTDADPDLEQIRQDVAAALVTGWEAFDGVVQNPTDEDVLVALRESSTPEHIDDIIDRFITFYVLNDLAERPNPDHPAGIEPHPETLVVDLESGTASMEYCFASTNELVQIQPDGSEILQDADVAVIFGVNTFELIDGRWLDSGGETLEIRDGESTCPAR